MANNATKWPMMIEAIYDSFKTGDHSGDAITRRILDKAVSWLVKGKKLSPKLQKALLLNIEQRTRFVIDQPPEEIRLTENQIKHIRRTKPEWVALAANDDGEDVVDSSLNGANVSTSIHPTSGDHSTTIQRLFNSLSTTIQRSFNDLSTIDPFAALALAQDLVAKAQFSCGSGTTSSLTISPKEEIMEDNERNHEGDMIAASQADAHEVPFAPGVSHNPLPLIPPSEEKVSHSGPGAGRAVLSFFHNDTTRPPSANLEIGEDRFALVFSDADTAEDGLRDVCDPEWLKEFEAAGGSMIRSESRAAGTTKTRCRMSPLYAEKDTFARKSPVIGNAVAVLFWNEDDQPERVTLISNNETVIIPLAKFHGKSGKAPSYKGEAKIAA